MIIIAHMFVNPNDVEKALPLFHQLVHTSRKEEGCLNYDLCRDMQDPAHFVVLEHWASPKAADTHGKQPQFTETVAKLAPFMAKEGSITLLDSVDIG